MTVPNAKEQKMGLERRPVMDELEKVERLRERANVSYEEAKKALEECNGDMLDAMVYLEKQGKVKQPGQTSYSTQYEEPINLSKETKESGSTSGIKDAFNRFFSWCGRVIDKGNHTYFKVDRRGENIINVPVTLFVIAMLLFFWALVWVLLIGLFLECRYSFEGVSEVQIDINKAMDKAADTADKIKNEFTDKK